MILYFSATGNGKYIAERIANEFDDQYKSIVDCIEEHEYYLVLWCPLIFGVCLELLRNT